VRRGLLLLGLTGLWACAGRNPDSVNRAATLLEGKRSQPGEVALLCEPSSTASVFVDGIEQGICQDFAGQPRGLSLGEGVHELRIQSPGFWPYVTYYEPSDVRKTLRVTLRPRNN
jgi:hypothetical protein